jgi:hypothetical protein
MAEGVQGAACIVCFMTQAYQDSVNCKLELKFAQQSGVPIVPVMMQPNFTAKKWLGILTAGSIWTPMYEIASLLDSVTKLIAQAQQVIPGLLQDADATSDVASETSEGTTSFDVAGWGEGMFSLSERREELERLRVETVPSAARRGNNSSIGDGAESLLCSLPAMVPVLPRGLFVTAEMQRVLDAVLSDASTPQIGFCGMGGIGKTTVSSWVAHAETVRKRFRMIAWISLGQTPTLDACINLLHLQLTGIGVPEDIPGDTKQELLKQAFLNRSVLLVLDDCWDVDVAKHFKWIDPNTNSKILISSRVRNALDGGDIIDVVVPSKMNAGKMLLSTADMDIEALQSRKEVEQIVELCKRLPLTLGIAGKLIKELATGSSMTDTSDWADLVALLKEEFNDTDGSLSVEESVIRASIKSIPKRMRKQVTRLFHGFALVPEDMHVPLPVLGMIFDACTNPDDVDANKKISTVPLSRMHIRNYLKVLIDRSLVLGTVDRPQLHDVMLDYVQTHFAGDKYKASQRRLVESLRKADRSPASATGKYMLLCIKYHITESHDSNWERSPQAMSWLEDHTHGVQDVVATSAASILPTEALATECEADKRWWQAALRWNAFAAVKSAEAGTNTGGNEYLKLAVNASANVVIFPRDSSSATTAVATVASSVSQFDLDSFDMYALNTILLAWDPADLAMFFERIGTLLGTEAAQSLPLLKLGVLFTTGFFPALIRPNPQAYAHECWKVATVCLETAADESNELGRILKPLATVFIFLAGELVMQEPGFTWDSFGSAGDKIVDYTNAYTYDTHHEVFVRTNSTDGQAYAGGIHIATLQFGRVQDSIRMADNHLALAQKLAANPAEVGYVLFFVFGTCFASAIYHVLNLSQHVQQLYIALGVTFDSVEERLREVTKDEPLFASMEHKGVGGGIQSLRRCLWQIKSFCVLHLNVSKADAIAWLESLPDNAEFIEYGMTMEAHDVGVQHGHYHVVWIALAHEKVGLHEGALRFADLQLEPDVSRGGSPGRNWAKVIALACKGRVLAQMGRGSEAVAAFQAAITVSQQSYRLMEAFAVRELSNYEGGGEAAAQASLILEIKLHEFDGRMTREEFNTLKIGP